MDITAIPDELRAELALRVSHGDLEGMRRVLDDAASIPPQVSSWLRRLASEYKYDNLRSVLGG